MTKERCSRFFLPWFLYYHFGGFVFLITFRSFEFSLWHDAVKRFLPVPRPVPFEEDLNDLVHGQYLPRRELREICSYRKTSMADAGLYRFIET